MVDVAEEEIVDWAVPIASKLIPGNAVPPICIEATIREIGEPVGYRNKNGFPLSEFANTKCVSEEDAQEKLRRAVM